MKRILKQILKNGLETALYYLTNNFESKNIFSTADMDIYAAKINRLKQKSSSLNNSEIKIELFEDVVFFPAHKAAYKICGGIIEESTICRWGVKNYHSAPCQLKFNEIQKMPIVDIAYLGGVFFENHFGHFITESLPRLWPITNVPDELVTKQGTWIFSQSSTNKNSAQIPSFAEQHLSFLEYLGFDAKIYSQPIRINKLFIPSSSHNIGESYNNAYRDFCINAGEFIKTHSKNANDPNQFFGKKIYLSRSKLSAGKRRIIGEQVLEKKLRSLGFMIVHPEKIPLHEQIILFEKAEAVVSCVGSSLHTQIYASKVASQIVIISNENPPLTYFNFDALCGTNSEYILGLSKSKFKSKYIKQEIMDVDLVIRSLEKVLGSMHL